jgi:hypothetical protein
MLFGLRKEINNFLVFDKNLEILDKDSIQESIPLPTYSSIMKKISKIFAPSVKNTLQRIHKETRNG